MSYHEENGEVVLTMSPEEFKQLREIFRAAIVSRWPDTMWILRLENRLNEGNSAWKPYPVEEKKS